MVQCILYCFLKINLMKQQLYNFAEQQLCRNPHFFSQKKKKYAETRTQSV